jgi:hypothetical protein
MLYCDRPHRLELCCGVACVLQGRLRVIASPEKESHAFVCAAECSLITVRMTPAKRSAQQSDGKASGLSEVEKAHHTATLNTFQGQRNSEGQVMRQLLPATAVIVYDTGCCTDMWLNVRKVQLSTLQPVSVYSWFRPARLA